MEQEKILKAIADDTRIKIVSLLLGHNYCVRALAQKLELSEAAVSQHLKVLREAGLLLGEKKGYYMHYDVNRELLHELAKEIDQLANIERKVCSHDKGSCERMKTQSCHGNKDECSQEVKEFCHGHNQETPCTDHDHHKASCHAHDAQDSCHGHHAHDAQDSCHAHDAEGSCHAHHAHDAEGSCHAHHAHDASSCKCKQHED